ncbi:M13 family metallopeptidase [Hyphobacterium sp. CCMP332]|nr:M13 family metallopeptidase [Hyphobacterium sp. CCMP332]
MTKLRKIVFIIPLAFWMISCQTGEKETEETTMKYIDVSNMDTTVRPQDDFFIYANGAWLDSNDIPASKSSWGSFNILAENNRKNLRKIVEAAANDSTAEEGSITDKVGDFYDSGMDSLKIEELGISPLQAQLDKIAGINSKEELIDAAAYLRSETVGTMFGMWVGQDEKNPEAYILNFYQGGLGLPDRDYYFKTDERSTMIQEEYKKHIAKMLEFTGYDQANAEEAALKVYELEKTLAENSRKRQDLRDAENNYNKFLLSDFDSELSNFPLTNFLNSLGLSEVKEIVVGQPEFYTGLNEALATIPLEDWKNYLKWNAISEHAEFLNNDIAQEDFHFYSTILRGVPEMEPRWKRVMLTINGLMGEAVGQVYVKEYFPPEAKDVAMTMINDIQAAFKERIQTLDWMSEETKEKALVKLSTFVKKIGYPDKWTDYSSVEISPDTYFQNVISASKFQQRENYEKLGKEIDRDEWFMSPPTVNAYYNPTMNEIVFPAGILAFPFFDFKADAAINYGGIGAVIGHELTHGFDDQGSKYDETGMLNNWWTDEDREKFDAKTQVLVDHYSNFTVLDTVHINGNLTLGENIADLGGLSIAYDALQKYYERNGQPEMIDGFTGNQRFFLSWAQVWRIKYTDDALMQRIMTDSHSPGMYRVNGVLSNMPEFYQAFNVEEGDQLYRPDDERAKIW